MQMLKTFNMPTTDLPPLYTWPAPLKRLILMIATGACLGAYILLAITGLLGGWIIWLELAVN